MRLGYNTNGLAHHDPIQAIELLAEIGYRSIALTVDHQWLNPFSDLGSLQVSQIKDLLQRHHFTNVIETGARFLLDPRQKHEPTLVSAEPAQRQRRIVFLKRCIDIAAELSSDAVSLWSGTVRDGSDDEAALERLASGLTEVVQYAEEKQVLLAFEPEPNMLIDTTSAFGRMLQWVDSPNLKMTMDIGHLCCLGEFPIVDRIDRWCDKIVNIHIEDMRMGVHDHLMFGEGEIDFPSVINALKKNDYQGGLHVELSRHSYDAVNIAQRCYDFLSALVN